MRHLRRFEILLPLRRQPGENFPPELFEQTRREIEYQFGAASLETQIIQGFDRTTGGREDRQLRLFTDVADTPENLAFFMQEKARLVARFVQEDIWITSFPIDVI
jgi:hypothetical protein